MVETAAECWVVFMPSGRRGRFAAGTPVLTAARSLGVDLDSVCGGRGICGRCQVEVAEGVFAKHGIVSATRNLAPASAAEARYADKRGFAGPARRLGCQALIGGDLVVDVPPESQLHRQVVRKAAAARPVTVDPAVRLFCVAVAEPDMHEPSSDFSRLVDALRQAGAPGPVTAEPAVLATLQGVLRRGGWEVTAAVRHDGRLVRLWPGFHGQAVGLAVDIGSTTVAAHLCDLASGDVLATAGRMNPQIRFGEDLMSRVSYAMLHPDGTAELTAAVRDAIRELAAEVAGAAGLAPADILETVVVGNPVMHHLFFGLDPSELGTAPFALAVDGAYETSAGTLGLGLAPGSLVHALPCIAGHVGADAAAMVLAERPDLDDAVRVLVDVGTNAEIVLGNRERLFAASSPTGPAFEGAQIACGQRAAPGAIERVRIDPETLEPRYRVIGCPLWSDEPGFEAAVAAFGVTGLCGSGIIELVAELFLAGVVTPDGVVDGGLQARSARIETADRTFRYVVRGGERPVALYQTDVRAIQLAKAALYAGIKVLMARAGVVSVDGITLAGAFGSHIDPRYAAILGMVPDCDLARVASAGNAAGDGARIALVDRSARDTVAALVRRIVKVETAVAPTFQEEFVAAMAFPHRRDGFPELARVVTFPLQADDGSPRRRRRPR